MCPSKGTQHPAKHKINQWSLHIQHHENIQHKPLLQNAKTDTRSATQQSLHLNHRSLINQLWQLQPLAMQNYVPHPILPSFPALHLAQDLQSHSSQEEHSDAQLTIWPTNFIHNSHRSLRCLAETAEVNTWFSFTSSAISITSTGGSISVLHHSSHLFNDSDMNFSSSTFAESPT